MIWNRRHEDLFVFRPVRKKKADWVEVLREWTGKGCAAIVFHSKRDQSAHVGLFEKVKGKPNIAVIGFSGDWVCF